VTTDTERIKAEAAALAERIKAYEGARSAARDMLKVHKQTIPLVSGLAQYAAETRRLNDVISTAEETIWKLRRNTITGNEAQPQNTRLSAASIRSKYGRRD